MKHGMLEKVTVYFLSWETKIFKMDFVFFNYLIRLFSFYRLKQNELDIRKFRKSNTNAGKFVFIN